MVYAMKLTADRLIANNRPEVAEALRDLAKLIDAYDATMTEAVNCDRRDYEAACVKINRVRRSIEDAIGSLAAFTA